jgi:excisionase family DNA binding protein
MSKIYGTKDAAEKLGVSQARIRQYIQEERLQATKIGRDHIIEGVVLEDFAEYGRKKSGRPQKKSCASDSIAE